MITEPMKAPREPVMDFATLQFPVMCSDKEDGIRCLTHPTLGPVSRSFKPIANYEIREQMMAFPQYLDGEIVALDAAGNTLSFNDTQSAVMSFGGEPRFEYRVFDHFGDPGMPFTIRKVHAQNAIKLARVDWALIPLTYIPHYFCENAEQLHGYMLDATERGKEGLIVRSLTGRYKSGRTTEREGIMFKLVTFVREEAKIIGFEPMMKNCNVATADNFGRTKRSKHAEGMVEQALLGAFIVENHWGQFRLSGFTMEQREEYWRKQDQLLWQTITYKYKPHGTKDVPRNPIYVGFRDSRDLD